LQASFVCSASHPSHNYPPGETYDLALTRK
jgi:hypothetical protein